MGVQSASVASIANSSSLFKTASKTGVSDLLLACGAVTQTADTGQIDLVSGTFTPATNTAQGYQMFAFADSLQATAPIYVKVEYGNGGNTSNPQLWVTIGTATNGSGTLTGTVSSRQPVFTTSSTIWGSATTHAVYANGTSTDGAVIWGGWWGGANYSGTLGGGLFCVERCRDADGTPNAYGAYVLTAGFGASAQTATDCLRFSPAGGSQSATARTTGMLPAWSNASGINTLVVGSDTYFVPSPTGFYVQTMGAPSKYLCGYAKGDFSLGASQSVSWYGSSKTFLCGGSGWTLFDMLGSNQFAPAMRIS